MRIKSKKKLALLVSMALTVGTSMAVSPMEAYAFTSVGYSEFMNGPENNPKPQGIYTVTKLIALFSVSCAKDSTAAATA